MTTVTERPGETFEGLIKRFRRNVQAEGVLSTVRRNRFFVPKSEERRKAKQRAIRKQRRLQRKLESRERFS